MHAHKQSSIVVYSDHAFDTSLIERDVLLSRDRHEVIRRECLGIDLRQQFPFAPAVIMLGGRQTEGFKWLRAAEDFVAEVARKKACQHGMVSLPHQDELVALLLN